METNGTSTAIGNNHVAFTIGQSDTYQAIVVSQVDSDHTIGTRTGESFEQCLLDDSSLGTEEEIVTIDKLLVRRQVLDTDKGIDLIVGIDIKEILNSSSFGILGTFGDFIHLQPIATPLGREQHNGGVHGGRVDILHEIFFASIRSLGSYSATSLRSEFAQRGTLDVAHVRKGDDHIIVGIEVFGVEFFRSIYDLAFASIAIFLFYLQQFAFDQLHQ